MVKVKVMGQANAVGPTSMEGSFSSALGSKREMYSGRPRMCVCACLSGDAFPCCCTCFIVTLRNVLGYLLSLSTLK